MHTEEAAMITDRERVKEDIYRRFVDEGPLRLRLKQWVTVSVWILRGCVWSTVRRVLELAAAIFLLIVFIPLYLLAILASLPGGIERTVKLGINGRPFHEYAFALRGNALGRLSARLRLRHLPVLWNIIKGDMSFIGPRPAVPGEMDLRDRRTRRRHEVKPGLVCLWWLRRRANIDYGSELEMDEEYLESRSLRGDIALATRAIPAFFYGRVEATSRNLRILGIPIANVDMHEITEIVMEKLEGPDRTRICFVNADCANIACRDHEYFSLLQDADFVLADGIGMKLAGRLLGENIKQNVNGTDLFPRLCQRLCGSGHGIFLLGAGPGVAQEVAGWTAEHYPGIVISGFHHGYFTPAEEQSVIDRIAASGADILLVAFGVPRQDTWIKRNLAATGVKVAMGVGGLFDFYSGRLPRAPLWVREIGMEWLYRLYQEPTRLWKRYVLGNSVFLFRVSIEKFRSYGRSR